MEVTPLRVWTMVGIKQFLRAASGWSLCKRPVFTVLFALSSQTGHGGDHGFSLRAKESAGRNLEETGGRLLWP